MDAQVTSSAFTLQAECVDYQGQSALTEITLDIPAGQKLAFVGRSGSGKSTLLKLLYERRSQDVALVSQDYGLVQNLSVFHNVYMGQLGRQSVFYNLINLIKPLQQPIAEVQKILNELGLADKLFEPAGQLSGGQQQRTAIARAMMQSPQILLADEPVSSLDEQQSKRVMQLLCGQFNTVVLAMHDIDLALNYCDRIIGLDDGYIKIDALADNLQRTDLLDLYAE